MPAYFWLDPKIIRLEIIQSEYSLALAMADARKGIKDRTTFHAMFYFRLWLIEGRMKNDGNMYLYYYTFEIPTISKEYF